MDQSSDLTNSLSDNPVIVCRSELLNLLVMDRDSMQEVGRVERLWMYPQAHRVLGVICKGGGLFSKQRWAYKLPQIVSLSSGNLWVTGPGTATDPEQLGQLQSLMEHEVWADGGDRLGLISDCLLNRKTGQITQYLFVNNRLRQFIETPLPLPPAEILSFGNQRALVRSDAMSRLRRERPNLRETLTQLKDEARAEYEQVTTQAGARLRNWSEEAKTAKDRFTDQAEQLRQQATQRAKALGEQVLEQSQELGQELGQQWSEQREERWRRPQVGQRVEQPTSSEESWANNDAWTNNNWIDEPEEGSVGKRLAPELGQQFTDQVQGLSQQASRRYRRLQRQAEGFIEDLPPWEELQGLSGQRRQKGSGGDRRSAHGNSTHDNSLHDQSDPWADDTWVDEAGTLPPAAPARQTASPNPVAPSHRMPSSDNAPASKPAPQQTQQGDRQTGTADQFVSRENPWGYADRATASDWGDLEEPITPQSIPSEDLDDEDPWI